MFTYSTGWSNVNGHKIKLEYPVDYISLLEPMVSVKIELKFSTGFRCSWRTRGRRGCNRYRPPLPIHDEEIDQECQEKSYHDYLQHRGIRSRLWGKYVASGVYANYSPSIQG